MHNSCRIIVCIVLLFLSATAGATTTSYLKQLVDKAREKQLSQHFYWHKLLHYHPDLAGSGVTSMVDYPGFFNAADGAKDPQAELEATLQKFLQGGMDQVAEEPVACRFIARYTWLNEQLQFDPQQIPPPKCDRLQEWLQKINPAGMTLIFPTAYMNNPSSMFGHTLIRIDARGQTEDTRLLAYSVNFAADTGNDGGVLFAVKGLLGGYAGMFSIAPYYLKVREYSDMENRDIWEYQLSFSTEETYRMLLHLWEMRGVYFNYFFFDENCSYHLLGLMQTARPELDLTSSFNWFAIPPDTVKRVLMEKGLVSDVTYRPSGYAELESGVKGLTDSDYEKVTQLAQGTLTPRHDVIASEPVERQARLLELGYELLNYQNQKNGNTSQQNKDRQQQLLLARSQLDIITDAPVIVPPGFRPDQGHGSSQLAFAAGQSDGDNYIELQYRPAYHDLLDIDEGFVTGAQIKFFDSAFRAVNDAVRVEKFSIIDIVSLTTRSRLRDTISWKFNFGVDRIHLSEDEQPLVFRLNGGPGMSWTAKGSSIIFALLDTTLDVANDLQDNYALGAGPDIGVISGWHAKMKTKLNLSMQRFALGETYTSQRLDFAVSTASNAESALRLEFSRHYEFERYWSEGNIVFQRYF